VFYLFAITTLDYFNKLHIISVDSIVYLYYVTILFVPAHMYAYI